MTIDTVNIRNILRKVVDPEVELNIVDLGLVYHIEIQDASKINIKMTLSTPACPVGEVIVLNVIECIRQELPGAEVDVELVFNPPWTPEMISQEGKKALASR